MRATSIKALLRAFPSLALISLLSILLLWTAPTHRDDSSLHSPPLRRALLRKLMQRNHRFVPASSPLFNYYGRWIATSNRLRKDASFPGSYLDFDICNTTSVYVTLGNANRNALSSDEAEAVKSHANQLFIQPNQDHVPSSPPVSLFLQIDQNKGVYFNQNGHGTLTVPSNLDKNGCHHIRLTHLAQASGQAGTLEFEGIWLDIGGFLISSETPNANDLPIMAETHPAIINEHTHARKHFELITHLPFENPHSTLNSWPILLARQTNTSHAIFPISSYCLTPACSATNPSISDIFFRSGPPDTANSNFNTPYRFPSQSPYPSALILDIGLLDYQTFLRTNPSTHAIKKFTSTFIKQYISFISLIRSTAYPYHSPYHSSHATQLGRISDEYASASASFTYNSAPSTLRIFLLTPFTPSKQIHRLLSHATLEVVNTLQKNGDKSTFRIDTSGWLTPEDFLPTEHDDRKINTSIKPEDREQVRLPGRSESTTVQQYLTSRAHRLISMHLSAHLCPYLSSYSSLTPHLSTTESTISSPPRFDSLSSLLASSPCPFNKHDNYLGNLYIPDEAGMAKLLEERKIELVKIFVGWEGMVT